MYHRSPVCLEIGGGAVNMDLDGVVVHGEQHVVNWFGSRCCLVRAFRPIWHLNLVECSECTGLVPHSTKYLQLQWGRPDQPWSLSRDRPCAGHRPAADADEVARIGSSWVAPSARTARLR
jgi:hypothetical protein